ncbi:MAG: hypothetical protein AAFO69_02315, partial [Bacteroidota bacterium]
FGKSGLGRWTRGWKSVRAFKKENYSSERLAQYLKSDEAFRDIAIGDQEQINCGLVINTKRADTYSLWSLANHPDGAFYEANKHLKLWELTKASSSAPYYFKPTALQIPDENGQMMSTAFIDGGVSLANNPAWQLFLVATVPSFGFNCETGEDKMSIITIGTGSGLPKEKAEKMLKKRGISWAADIPDLFMTDASELNQVALCAFGKNIGEEQYIDSQFGNMEDVNYLSSKLFSFQRYNVQFAKSVLNERLGFNFSDKELRSLTQMDHVENMEDWAKIGQRYAKDLKIKVE